jgi:two-component system, LuxR family, response regulator DctR
MTPREIDAESARVYVVDDDEAVRNALAFLLRSRGVESVGFASAEAFLDAYTPALRGCILTDVRMGVISGIELFTRLAALGSLLPCIILTGHGDVPMAVEALKMGARDFIEKPFDGNLLVDKLIAAMAADATRAKRDEAHQTTVDRIASLSQREQEVMALIQSGKLNKVIADELGIAIRTVEAHRAKIFEKMGVKSAVELANLTSKRT